MTMAVDGVARECNVLNGDVVVNYLGDHEVVAMVTRASKRV